MIEGIQLKCLLKSTDERSLRRNRTCGGEIQGEEPAASWPIPRTGDEMDAWNRLFQCTFL